MTTSILLNALSVLAVRMVTPDVGVWYADCDLDPEIELPALPPGPAILKIGTTPIVCFLDPAAQGVFGPKASCRVVGGLGGWSRSVPPLHFHNDGILTNAVVIAATAAGVGEKAVVVPPLPIGTDYVRLAGPASRVLEGLDWHVDLLGVTQVSPRIPVPADPTSIEVLDYDPISGVVTIGADDIVSPGMILLDPRFGALVVRDVEQSWTPDGARARAWTSKSTSSPLDVAFANYVREKAGVAFLKIYRYRIVLQGPDGRVTLQPVDILGDAPPTLLLKTWSGDSGITQKFTPATEVLVEFENGDPSKPLVRGFQVDGIPLETTIAAALKMTIAATVEVEIGPLCSSVVVGPAPVPLATAAPSAAGFAALSAYSAALSTFGAALATYAAAIKPIADPTNAATPALLAAVTAMASASTALANAITAAAPTLATLVLKGT